MFFKSLNDKLAEALKSGKLFETKRPEVAPESNEKLETLTEEQIDELSVGTMKRYVKKASNMLPQHKAYRSQERKDAYHLNKAGDDDAAFDATTNADWAARKVKNQTKGIKLAQKKIKMKEAIDELTEEQIDALLDEADNMRKPSL